MENEFNCVAHTLPGLVWTALPDGRFDFLSRGWREYSGLKLAEVNDRGWQHVVHPDDLPELLERWRSILTSRVQGGIEARLQRFDKEHCRFLIRTVPVTMSKERSCPGMESVSIAMIELSSANDLKFAYASHG